eukprot:6942892-Pyramimonas_sp.AAC.1
MTASNASTQDVLSKSSAGKFQSPPMTKGSPAAFSRAPTLDKIAQFCKSIPTECTRYRLTTTKPPRNMPPTWFSDARAGTIWLSKCSSFANSDSLD